MGAYGTPSARWTWDVIEDPDVMERLAAEWDALAVETALPSFAGASFALAYRRAFFSRRSQVAVHVLRCDGALSAVLPLQRRGGLIRSWLPFVNEHTPCTAFAMRGPSEVAERILHHLLGSADRVSFRRLHLGEAQWQLFRDAASALRLSVATRRSWHGDTYIELKSSWEAFQASIPKKVRHDVQRRLVSCN